MKHRRWFKAFALVAVLSIVAAACANDSGGGGGGGDGGVDCATVEFGCVEVGADEAINLGAAQVISGADATLGQDQVNAIELALDHLDGHLRPEGRHAARAPGQAHDRGRAVLRGRRADRRDRPRRRRLDRGGHRDELLERRARGRGQAPRGQGRLADPRIEHQPGPHGPGAAQPVLRPDRPQRPHPGRDRRRVRSRRGAARSKSAATIADESPYTQGLVGASRRTSKPGAGR